MQFEREGMSQVEFARRTGIGYSHLNAIRNMETASSRGIGAHIVRLVRNGLGIHPDYFYDDYEGEKDHKVYQLSAKREERRFAAIEETLAQQQRELAKLAELAAENLELKQQNAALERKLTALSRKK